MKNIGLFALLFFCVVSCNNKKKDAPDVSAINMDLTTKRFDQDFFAVDTLALDKGMAVLQQKYPEFLQVFLQNIVGVNDPEGLKNYIRSYKQVYDSAQLIYKDFSPVEKELEQAFRYVKHYFPDYKTPTTVFPIVGPMNSREDLARMENGEYTPNFIRPGYLGISLQFYLGEHFSLYSTEYFINMVAPLFRSRRFAKEYITADVMKLIAFDLFPDQSSTSPLIERMIGKGKQWWLLDKFMPEAPDSVKTGYTQLQLDWVKENEGLVWSYIIKNENLYSINPATIQTYIGEAPFTSIFSQENSPGNIGPWIGWQIVKKYEERNPGIKLDEVMKADAKKILEGAKYKP